jgi:hypothetical protein
MIQVFLSSTTSDLAECRTLAYHAIEGLTGYHCVRMEDFGAWDVVPEDLCERRVAGCDLFVILAGPLYGTTLASGMSYTEREYEVARSLGLPCLCFLTSDDFLIPADRSEPAWRRRKQQAFRHRLSENGTFRRFANCTGLPTMVVQSIHNWEASPIEHSLVRITRKGSTETHEYRRPFLRLGRNPESEISISDDTHISWDHGVIFKHAGDFYYRHLSAVNPAWVTTGTRQVMLQPSGRGEVILQACNEIRIGDSRLLVDVLARGGGRSKTVPTDKQDDDD